MTTKDLDEMGIPQGQTVTIQMETYELGLLLQYLSEQAYKADKTGQPARADNFRAVARSIRERISDAGKQPAPDKEAIIEDLQLAQSKKPDVLDYETLRIRDLETVMLAVANYLTIKQGNPDFAALTLTEAINKEPETIKWGYEQTKDCDLTREQD